MKHIVESACILPLLPKSILKTCLTYAFAWIFPIGAMYMWDKVVQLHKANNRDLTINTEFGPFPYMPTLPFSEMPIVNQWDINVYMMNLLKYRYNI